MPRIIPLAGGHDGMSSWRKKEGEGGSGEGAGVCGLLVKVLLVGVSV